MLDGNQTSINLLKQAFADDAAPDELDFASLISTFVVRRDLEIEAEELIKELKELFSSGKCPSGADFAKLIDSFIYSKNFNRFHFFCGFIASRSQSSRSFGRYQ